MGAGAYLLTVCDGDEHGPELVISMATEEEKIGRTVGDLGEVVKGEEIPLDRIAVRIQFASLDGLGALEQQLRFIRDEFVSRGATLPSPLSEIPDNELPGMWERADFEGGQEEVRGHDWKRPVGVDSSHPARATHP